MTRLLPFLNATRIGRHLLLVLVLTSTGLGLGCGSEGAPQSEGGPVAMRRLTESQYRNAIADVFGSEIEIAGRFEPDNRRDGLIAVGSALVSVTPSGFEQYESIATSIAGQVVSPRHRDRLVPCQPQADDRPDAVCSEAFLRRIGPRLLRRPLGPADVGPRIAAAGQAADLLGDFYAGLELVVTSLLVAPDFLFRVESVRTDAVADAPPRLTDATLASRLSYLLWNSGPDDTLLEAVAAGELADPDALARQVDRMIDSPRFADGVRALFEDIFRFDEFESLGKDPIRYPGYSTRVAEHAREQTLRVVVDHLVARQGDYRELFTTRRSFMTRTLGPVYAIPVRAESGWESIDFPEGDPRTGLLSHASFSMLHAHPGRSSATLRGQFLRESLLCQTVPAAPADVDFGLFNADDNPEFKTARDRLGAHASNATCRNCHKLTDPIGLGLEVFDGMGRYRTTENGAPIDPSGELDGRSFDDPAGFGRALAESELVGACLVENVYRYAVGRDIVHAERRLLRHFERRLESLDYRLDRLLREVALSDGFQTARRSAESMLNELARLEQRGSAS
jgi:hypothetical protein